MSAPDTVTQADFLSELRRINGERAEAWLMGQRSDPLFWAVELGGEVGEILNVVKKLVREELGWRGSRATVQDLADEIADGIICLDSLARHYGIDLASAVAAKFNATSEKNDFPHRIQSTASASDARVKELREALADAVGLMEEEGWAAFYPNTVASYRTLLARQSAEGVHPATSTDSTTKPVMRPAEPEIGERWVAYRGWECSYNTEAALWGLDGWEAYLGGPDIDAPRVTARTWADLLDEIDDHDMTEAPDA